MDMELVWSKGGKDVLHAWEVQKRRVDPGRIELWHTTVSLCGHMVNERFVYEDESHWADDGDARRCRKCVKTSAGTIGYGDVSGLMADPSSVTVGGKGVTRRQLDNAVSRVASTLHWNLGPGQVRAPEWFTETMRAMYRVTGWVRGDSRASRIELIRCLRKALDGIPRLCREEPAVRKHMSAVKAWFEAVSVALDAGMEAG